MAYTHPLDLFGRQKTELNLLDGAQGRTRVLKKQRHDCGYLLKTLLSEGLIVVLSAAESCNSLCGLARVFLRSSDEAKKRVRMQSRPWVSLRLLLIQCRLVSFVMMIKERWWLLFVMGKECRWVKSRQSLHTVGLRVISRLGGWSVRMRLGEPQRRGVGVSLKTTPGDRDTRESRWE